MLSIMLSYPDNMKEAEVLAINSIYFYFGDILTWLGEGNHHPDKWIECVKMKGRLDDLVIQNGFTGFIPIKANIGILRKDVIFHDNGLEVSFPGITCVGMRGQMYDVVVYGHEGGIMSVKTTSICDQNFSLSCDLRNLGCFKETRHEYREYVPRMRIIDSNIAVTKVRTFGDPVNTVKLEFNDGTSSTAVCSENDEFNLDIGIGLCIAKRVIGPDFLNAITRAKKLYVRQHKAEEKEKSRRIEERALEKRRREKAAKRRAKREEKRIKREAAIMAEAMKLAEIREKNNDYNSEQKLD